jgi:tripartite-type tricarboxylate transporter receptor subunit TctC
MTMRSSSRRRFAAGLALTPFAGYIAGAFAQGALPKAITFVVPNAAGGSNDVMARAVAARLPQVLGTNVVVENKPGAGGNVGSAWVARSAPRDGSTWLVTVNSAQTVNPALYKNTGFDPIADFEPVAGIAVVQHAILATPSLPVGNLAELTALARADPGKYSFGSAGNGSFAHLLMEVFKKQQGVQMTHVPYKGVAPALTDLIAGNLHVLVSTIPACLQFIRSGQVKPLAVPSQHRAPALPNVPLATDTVPGLAGDLWVAIYAPKGVGRDQIEQMRAAVARVLALPEMEQFFTAQGASALKAGPAEVLAMTREELGKWGPVVRESGMRVD